MTTAETTTQSATVSPWPLLFSSIMDFPRIQFTSLRQVLLGRTAASASLLFSVIGGGTLAWQASKWLQDVVYRYCVSTIHISSRDEAFQWLMSWLAESEYTIHRANQLVMLNSQKQMSMTTTTNAYGHNAGHKERHKVPMRFVPAPGTHWMQFKGRWLWIEYVSYDDGGGNGTSGGGNAAYGNEKFVIKTWGSGKSSTAFLKQFVEDMRDRFLQSKHGKTLVYVNDLYCDVWEPRIMRQKRKANTVVLRDGIFERLLDDCRDFLTRQEWYDQRGIPFRRGVLLHGPPGTGKTSTVTVLAGVLDLNVCVVSLTNRNLSDDKLNQLLLNAPPNSILLLEDIDHALGSIQNREHGAKAHTSSEDEYDDASNGISLTGLLNSIDGVIAQEGRLLFCTTNHLERLPDSLIRPGRIDSMFLFDYADEAQMGQLFKKFYPSTTLSNDREAVDQHAARFVERVHEHNTQSRRFTPAELQGYFMQFKDDPVAASENVTLLFDTEYMMRKYSAMNQ